MSDPTTAETPTMRERLDNILSNRMNEYRRASTSFEEREIIAEARTAFLSEMLEPSEGFIDAMMRGFHLGEEPRQAMRDALVNGVYSILNETQD